MTLRVKLKSVTHSLTQWPWSAISRVSFATKNPTGPVSSVGLSPGQTPPAGLEVTAARHSVTPTLHQHQPGQRLDGREIVNIVLRCLDCITNHKALYSNTVHWPFTHHPSRLVVVEIHQVPQLARLLQLPFVGAVDELPRKVDPVAQVVTEMCLYWSVLIVRMSVRHSWGDKLFPASH